MIAIFDWLVVLISNFAPVSMTIFALMENEKAVTAMAEYIEREALCKILENWRNAHADVDDEQGCGLLEDVICEVDAQTAADVAPVVHGRWISWEEAGNFVPSPDRHECSVCHDAAQVLVNGFELLSDYCPNCGAKMDGGDSDEAD